MPWTDLKPRRWPAFGDHVNRQLAQAEAAREGAQRVGADEQVALAH